MSKPLALAFPSGRTRGSMAAVLRRTAASVAVLVFSPHATRRPRHREVAPGKRSTLHPYHTQLLTEAHRQELLRSAEAWRLAHPVDTTAPKRTRRWIPALPWRRTPVVPACSLLPLDRRWYESNDALATPHPESVGRSLMTVKRTSSGVGLPAGFPFSLAAEAHGLCFLSGMLALDADGKFAPGTFGEETERAWHSVVAIAEASGCSIDDVVYVQCVLSDIDNYGDLNAWWRRQFPDISTAPARFTFQAAALPFGAKIEIQAIAARRT